MVASVRQVESMTGPILVDESVTQSEFARRVGCSKQNISKLVKQGKLKRNEKGRLDFYQALKDYEDNTDPGHHERLGKPSLADDQHEVEPTKTKSNAQGGAAVINTGDLFKQHRAKREGHSAELVEIKLAKESGKLIDADKVKKDAFNLARGLRDAILNVPQRLAPILAAEQDDKKIERILDEELTKALNGLVAEASKLKTDVSE